MRWTRLPLAKNRPSRFASILQACTFLWRSCCSITTMLVCCNAPLVPAALPCSSRPRQRPGRGASVSRADVHTEQHGHPGDYAERGQRELGRSSWRLLEHVRGGLARACRNGDAGMAEHRGEGGSDGVSLVGTDAWELCESRAPPHLL